MRIFALALCFISLPMLTAAKTTGTQFQEPIALLLDKVIDGNTFLTGGNIIRLWGIEVPDKNDPYALAAKLYLETILKEASFSCHYKNKDEFKRYVMQCFSGQDDIASKLVRMGVAKGSAKYSGGIYAVDENFAKENHYGIWKK